MFGCFGVAHAGLLEGVRMHEAPNYTRVVFDTSERVEYKLFVLTNPHRVVIDLKNTSAKLAFDPSVVAVGRDRLKAPRPALPRRRRGRGAAAPLGWRRGSGRRRRGSGSRGRTDAPPTRTWHARRAAGDSGSTA